MKPGGAIIGGIGNGGGEFVPNGWFGGTGFG